PCLVAVRTCPHGCPCSAITAVKSFSTAGSSAASEGAAKRLAVDTIQAPALVRLLIAPPNCSDTRLRDPGTGRDRSGCSTALRATTRRRGRAPDRCLAAATAPSGAADRRPAAAWATWIDRAT